MLGPSMTTTHGDLTGEDHKRHRRVMNPAFGLYEAKALVPVFTAAASSLSNKWKDLLLESRDHSEVFDVPRWTSRATLDAIGHAGFDYNFGAMDNKENRLASAYNNLLQLITDIIRSTLMPVRLIPWLLGYMSKSNPQLARVRTMRDTATEVAREVVAEKSEEILNGQGNRLKDIMSLLVKANMSSQNGNSRLSNEELMAEMLTMFLAGHETTAVSITWTLLELSRRPEIQAKLREEILAKEREISLEGRRETGFSAEDFESLPYMNAVVKESLRYHPVGTRITKTALADDCLPFSETITTIRGVEINELPVSKGTQVHISIAAYNRSEALFGDDAHTFRPERWLEENGSGPKKGGANGVYSNLMTFSGGPRACIGWRFAVFEFQAFLVELIRNFEFLLTPECERIRRESAAVMLPVIEGEVEKGAQCPLRVINV
ncbi:hypothetical protein V5O48_005547 [Marasmius crinis-equi]|uniref:Cytochrome P450 n=1 Tax=Marasmius crinis-equi TaxID=585013 RepID=A0ABR3FLZ1_9AGAR